jgi:hypothetical protein
MKDPTTRGKSRCGPQHPVVCRGSCFELERQTGIEPDFETLFRRWRLEHLERDWSFRARVLRSVGLLL